MKRAKLSRKEVDMVQRSLGSQVSDGLDGTD